MKRRTFLRALTATGMAAAAGLGARAFGRAPGSLRAQQPSPSALTFPSWIASVAEAELLLSRADCTAAGLPYWPDGNIGVLHAGQDYVFVAASHGHVSRTTGTLANPAAGTVLPEIGIQNLQHSYNYAGGGPILAVTAGSALLVFYHAEIWPNNDPTPTTSTR